MVRAGRDVLGEFAHYYWERWTEWWGKWVMLLTEVEKTLGSVAAQLMNGEVVLLEDQKIPVRRVGSGRLRMVQFRLNGRVFEAIEQNREKPSRWGKLAREKHQVVQFRDVETHKYVAVSVDGEVREYGRQCRVPGTEYRVKKPVWSG
ncbi:MAG: hypothetical protein WB799_24440 [Candidatus Sulfotelmatobacter sp.]